MPALLPVPAAVAAGGGVKRDRQAAADEGACIGVPFVINGAAGGGATALSTVPKVPLPLPPVTELNSNELAEMLSTYVLLTAPPAALPALPSHAHAVGEAAFAALGRIAGEAAQADAQ